MFGFGARPIRWFIGHYQNGDKTTPLGFDWAYRVLNLFNDRDTWQCVHERFGIRLHWPGQRGVLYIPLFSHRIR